MIIIASLLIVIFYCLSQSYGSTFVLYVFRSNGSDIEIFDECAAMEANFGTKATDDEYTFCAAPARPLLACTKLEPMPANVSTYCINGFYAVAKRGNCTFALKAFNAQTSNYTGLLVVNDDEELFTMAGDGHYEHHVTIPALMIPRNCGFKVTVNYPWNEGFGLVLRVWWSYDSALRFLIPFVVVISLSFIILVIIMGVRWHRSRRRLQRLRLTKRQLKRIPAEKFKKGERPETCAICLEDFIEGDKMRILGCSHCYHCVCVDPWLLKGRRVCPICKRNAIDGSVEESDVESGDERITPNEVAPLLLASSSSSSESNINVGNSVFYTDYGSTGECALPSPVSQDEHLSNDPPLTWHTGSIGQHVVHSIVGEGSCFAALSGMAGTCDTVPSSENDTAFSVQGGVTNPSFTND